MVAKYQIIIMKSCFEQLLPPGGWTRQPSWSQISSRQWHSNVWQRGSRRLATWQRIPPFKENRTFKRCVSTSNFLSLSPFVWFSDFKKIPDKKFLRSSKLKLKTSGQIFQHRPKIISIPDKRVLRNNCNSSKSEYWAHAWSQSYKIIFSVTLRYALKLEHSDWLNNVSWLKTANNNG